MSQVTREEMEGVIRKFAYENPDYREALLEDPKGVVAKQMGQEPPEWLQVKIIEETPDTIYITIPPLPPGEGDELSDADLEQVAGGKGKGGGGGAGRYEQDNTYTCNEAAGVATRVDISTDVSAG